MVFTVHGIVPPSCCMYFFRLCPQKYTQPSCGTNPIHCKNHDTTSTCTQHIHIYMYMYTYMYKLTCTFGVFTSGFFFSEIHVVFAAVQRPIHVHVHVVALVFKDTLKRYNTHVHVPQYYTYIMCTIVMSYTL